VAKTKLNTDILRTIVELIPASWLGNTQFYADAEAQRAAYLDYLQERLAYSTIFVEEAQRARNQL
jgi:hypothetical protein